MADFAASFDKQINSTVSSSFTTSSGPIVDDSFEDACSICLEPFTTADPSTVTSCKHEYHLHCILEWSQRSKECPICWQSLSLKDPASQELMAAVETERNSRARHRPSDRITVLPSFGGDYDSEHDAIYSDDSDFDERIMRHLAAAASRARYICRRGRERSSGHSPSPERFQHSGYGILEGDSPNSSISSSINVQASLSPDPSVGNAVSNTAINRDGPFKPRALFTQSPPVSPRRSSLPEFSFSDSMKARLSAASSSFNRCKDSLSKGSRGFREKILASNTSVKELSKGVQREMNAGIAGVARVLERLDLASKCSRSSISDSSCVVGSSNFSLKGKGVQDDVISQSHNLINEEIGHDNTSDNPSNVSNTIPGHLEVSHSK